MTYEINGPGDDEEVEVEDDETAGARFEQEIDALFQRGGNDDEEDVNE